MEQTPKGDLELACRGVECIWGKRKFEFRKHSNLVSSKENFEKRVMVASASVTPRRSRAYHAQGEALQAGVPHAQRWARG
jgi:hypothetical protein